MANEYGPWATSIDAGGNPQLSTFWRRRLTMLVPTSQTSPVLSRRTLLGLGAAGVLTSALPTLRVATALADPGPAVKITPQAFARLPEDQQKAMLLDGVRRIRQKCSNISLKTATRVQKADVDPTTWKVRKVLEDFGSCAYELRRIDGSYRIAHAQYRPGVREPTIRCTDHYSAESGVNRGVATQRLAEGKEQEHGLISKEHSPSSWLCRYASYLGGLGFLCFPENDSLGFLLDHRRSLRVRGIDQKNGLVEAHFTYRTTEPSPSTGSCTLWFDLGKDWMLTRWVWEKRNSREKQYERFEVTDAKVFDGVWMPVRFANVTWLSVTGATDEDLKTPVGNLQETTAEDIKIGHVKKEDLEVIFPPHTLVRDEISGTRWSVGESGEKLPYDDTVRGR